MTAATIEARHRDYAERLPREPGDLWDALVSFGDDDRESLFAHCTAHGVNAVHEAYNRRPRALAHAERLAAAVDLDMAQAWTPTAENFIGRVTKAQIVEAVREALGSTTADRLTGMKKPDMVAAAEVQLAGTGWMSEPLRTPGQSFVPVEGEAISEDVGPIEAVEAIAEETREETAAIDSEQAIDDVNADGETETCTSPRKPSPQSSSAPTGVRWQQRAASHGSAPCRAPPPISPSVSLATLRPSAATIFRAVAVLVATGWSVTSPEHRVEASISA